MTKRRKRLIAIAVILLLLLLALVGYFYFYSQTKKLTFNLVGSARGTIPVPEFLFSFSGTGTNRMQRPMGVLVDKGTVYVTDSVRSAIFTFDEDGQMTGSFGTTETINPLYLAKNPKDGNIYVTDRRRYTILKYTPEGRFLGEFDPKLPKAERPPFETRGVKWQPIAIAFAPDGTMYVTELLNGHRLLVFDPTGKFLRSIGTAGSVSDPALGPEVFQFPNGILVVGKEVYVADSNNQRVKVYTRDGTYTRTIVTGGLPRGLAPLSPFPGDDEKSPKRFVQTDTLAHDATIWTATGEKLLSFGEKGLLDGQFSYPGAVAKGTRNRMFIADTANGRVQAWGWPAQAAGVPQLDPATAPWCLLPLLLLPFLLLLRRREFYATPDFVEAMIATDQLELMPHRRRRWSAIQADYDVISALETDAVDLSKLFTPVEFSESDVKALMDKYEFDHETAAVLAAASRAKVACFEDEELRRLGKMMEIDVVNAEEFVERFTKRAK